MANFLKNNGLYLLIIFCILALLSMMLVNVHAEEYEDIGSIDNTDSSFDTDLFNDLSEIKQSLKILEDNSSKIIENQQDISFDLAITGDQIKKGVSKDRSDGDESTSDELEDSRSDDAEPDWEGSESNVSGEEISTSSGEPENSDEKTSVEYDPEQIERVISGLNTLHNDLFKVMLSIWAMAGLVLGTKLISRLFGV